LPAVKALLAAPRPQPIAASDGHRWGGGYGMRRCTRCYAVPGYAATPCPGRPAAIVIDPGQPARGAT
jgi:hypothetical protein